MNDLNLHLEQYILEITGPEDEVLEKLNRYTHLKIMHPRMLSGHLQGQILRMLCMMIRPDKILEIGTYTGYSAICLAKGLNEGGILHTIEINDELSDISTRYIKSSGLENNIRLHTGDAKLIIPTIDETFDLVFLDGEKSEYLSYYQLFFDKVRTGGFIFADNVLWSGKVLKEEKNNDYFTKGIKEFNEFIKNDRRVEKVILPVRDGLMILRKL
jgi:predicted O-methyltransferase YrrM